MHDIIIDNISKSFGNVSVFDGFSAVLESGRIYRLTAPSGAGKTTLLRMLMRLEMPDSGSICGIPRDISAVFQEDRLIDEMSVYNNIAIAANIRMRSEKFADRAVKTRNKSTFTDLYHAKTDTERPVRRDAAADISCSEADMYEGCGKYAEDTQPDRIMVSLRKLGIAEYADKPVSELSGGMKRRTALIRAMMHDSELVLLDEPFTGLDDEARGSAAEYILGSLSGRTCVIASHIIDPGIEARSKLIDI